MIFIAQQFRPSVRLSVRPSGRPTPTHAGIVPRWIKIGLCGFYCVVAKHSSFLTPTMVGGDVPFHLKFTLKMTQWPISAYNVSTVKASEKCSLIADRKSLRAFQRAIDEVRTLPLSPLSPSKEGSKGNFSFLWIKIDLNRIKYATRFLYVKPSCSKVIAEPFRYLTV